MLNDACANTSEFKDFAQGVGFLLNSELANGAPINSVNLKLRDFHPKWGKDYQFKGLQILINDTEQTFVYTQSFQWLNPEQTHWSGNFCFRIVDNYGLDDPDVIKYGPEPFTSGGFFGWWLLQHNRGRAPFINEIYINCDIEGKF